MSLADDLDAREAELSMGDILGRIEDADREALLRALTDLHSVKADGRPIYRWSETALAKRLDVEGWKVSAYQIRRWRQANVTR